MRLIISVFAGGARAAMRTAERECVSKTFSLPVVLQEKIAQENFVYVHESRLLLLPERSIVFTAQQQKLQTYC